MFNNKNSLINAIVIIVFCLITVATACFFIGSGDDVKNAWATSPTVFDDGTTLADGVIVKNDDNENIEYLYVFLGSVYTTDKNGSVTVFVDYSSSYDLIKDYDRYTSYKRLKFTITNARQKQFSWICLNADKKLSLSESYFRILTQDAFEAYEISFLNDKSKVVRVNYVGCYYFDSKMNYVEGTNNDFTAKYLVDGQDSFVSYNKTLNKLSDSDSQLLSAVSSLYNQHANQVSNYLNPFGVCLASIGYLLFGTNGFAIRFIPLLFALANLILLFLFSRSKLNKLILSLILPIAYLLFAVGLTLLNVGFEYHMVAFFVNVALVFALKFFSVGLKHNNVIANGKFMLFSGLFYGLAISTCFNSVVMIILLLGTIILRAVKDIRNYNLTYQKTMGINKEYARENLIQEIRGYVLTIILYFVILPIIINFLCYGITYSAYASYYDTTSVFEYMAKNNGNTFFKRFI